MNLITEFIFAKVLGQCLLHPFNQTVPGIMYATEKQQKEKEQMINYVMI